MKLPLEGSRHSAAPATGSRPPPVSAADAGLLLLRVTFGVIMAGHGAQKLFGWFGGPGLDAAGQGFAALGYEPGVFFAGLAGISELLGGLGLALGLLTPLASAALIGVMINAMALASDEGLLAVGGAFEYPMTIAVVALTVAAVGPGRLSLDVRFPWRDGGWRPAAFALGVGGIGAAIVLAL
ncbi:DoxX family protein [Streptomyces sp. NPDC058572]|uniref:DoxX family protein n=1 Tax=Streptomyces sp. NPDC058572 TaxID=3346546 RepID=UPI003653ECD9